MGLLFMSRAVFPSMEALLSARAIHQSVILWCNDLEYASSPPLLVSDDQQLVVRYCYL